MLCPNPVYIVNQNLHNQGGGTGVDVIILIYNFFSRRRNFLNSKESAEHGHNETLTKLPFDMQMNTTSKNQPPL